MCIRAGDKRLKLLRSLDRGVYLKLAKGAGRLRGEREENVNKNLEG